MGGGEVTSHGLDTREALTGYRGIITGVPEPRTVLSTPFKPVELKSVESATLETLLLAAESSPETIADASGPTLEEILPALGELAAAHYVTAVDVSGNVVYRAATRSLRYGR